MKINIICDDKYEAQKISSIDFHQRMEKRRSLLEF